MKITKQARLIITILVTTLIYSQRVDATYPNAPYHLRTFDKNEPIGTSEKPYHGWYINDPDDNEIQSAYQIIVASTISDLNAGKGDIWDSGKVLSRKQNYIYTGGKTLAPATRYYWKVRTWDKDGNVSPYSATASFATGLLNNSDWEGAKWIKRDSNNPDNYTYFRKKTTLPNKTIKRATIYIASCHSYELYVNNHFIGKGFNNHYPQYSYYHAWDITSTLQSNSENTMACLTHWYGGGQGRAKGSSGLLVKTIVEYTDLTSTVICSNNTWKQMQARQWVANQPQRNSEGVGEIEMIDSRMVVYDWYTSDYDDSTWMFAKEIGEHPVAPWTGTLRADLTRVIEEEIKPASVTNLGNGMYVIDLGKIYPGSFNISFSGGIAGDTIKMVGGFVLNNDGSVSTKFNQNTKMDFNFILNGNTAKFSPYVYLGMRYLQVNNSPNDLTIDNIRFIKRHFELDPSRAAFTSSAPMLNNVWDLMCHSLIVGTQEDFVDTPTREKGSFLGDGWSQAVPALSAMGDRTMNLRTLNQFLDSQDQYWPDGRLNAVYPNVDGARDIPDYTQSFLIWIWDYYMQTGNETFLKENYSRLKKIADYVDAYTNNTTGLVHKLKGGGGQYEYGIIDWPDCMRYGYDMLVESRTVIDVYAYADFNIISEIAEVTGNRADAELYKNKAEAIKTAINKQLINEQGVYIDGLYNNQTRSHHVSQHANILPMAMDLVPELSVKPVVTEIVNQKMNVGMVCLRWLPEALGKADQGPQLIDLYTNTDYDGWAKIIALGGTVTWESWNANITNLSMSHPWGAVGILAMQRYILGIQPLEPQHQSILIKPLEFGDKLTHARGLYPTDKGDIMVYWKNNHGNFELTVSIPDNITAKVYIPKGGTKGDLIEVDGSDTKGTSEGNYVFVENIGSGVHTFKRASGSN